MVTREIGLVLAAVFLAAAGAVGSATWIAFEFTTQQPTYHCDGSETHGFAEPGSPEAAACWTEWKK